MANKDQNRDELTFTLKDMVAICIAITPLIVGWISFSSSITEIKTTIVLTEKQQSMAMHQFQESLQDQKDANKDIKNQMESLENLVNQLYQQVLRRSK